MPPRRANLVPVETEQRVADMIRVGGVPTRIANLCGVRMATVRRVARDIGMPLAVTKTPPRKTPIEVEDRIADMLRAGTYHRVIADEIGVSRSVVNRVALERGISHQHPAEVVERVESLLKSGTPVARVATIVGLSIWSVDSMRKRAGLPPRRKPWRPVTTHELDAARRLLEDGANYEEVARTLGRCGQTWARHLPGYAWSKEERAEWNRVCRMREGDHGGDVFDLAFAKRERAVS